MALWYHKYIDSKDTVATQALMLEFSKAFDRMTPEIAVEKMLKLHINPCTIRLVQSFLSDRFQCVKYQCHTSQYLPSHIGGIYSFMI